MTATRGSHEAETRVLMLTPDVGQLDRRIAQEAASLAARGVEVDIYPAADPQLDPGGPLAPRVRLLTNLAMPDHSTRARRVGKAVKAGLRRYAPALLAVTEAAQYQVTDPAGDLDRANRETILGLGRYDMLFAHDIPVLPLASQLKDAWGSPVICDFHEVFPEQPFFDTESVRRYWRSVEEQHIGRVDGLICVNEAVLDYAIGRYRPIVPTAVVNNSVPYVARGALTGPTVREIYEIPAEARVLVFGGSLRPNNNLETMIRGFIQARLDDWALAIVGGGALLPELEQLVDAEGVRGQVFIGRRVAQHELLSILASADAGLIPYTPLSLNLEISTPNKLFEYIQARLPIASCTLPLIRRHIEEHGNGRFVDYSTPESTARDLRRFIETDLGSISREVLEAAARNVCWEVDESRLLALVDAVGSAAPRLGSPAQAKGA